MNVYARIRSIEDPIEFKRFFNTLLGAEFGIGFQATKDWHDFGIDGYQRDSKTVYAVYCPQYPERRELSQYRTKIRSDIESLTTALKDKKVTIKVEEWIFVTPDDLPMEIIEYIRSQLAEHNWRSGALTAQVLAPLFMKHSSIHVDFPSITAGLLLDRIPSIDIRLAYNRYHPMLELFNDGTEDIKNIEVHIRDSETTPWREIAHFFIYEFDNPRDGHGHSLYNLKKGERQYCNSVPIRGGFDFKLSGIGVESGKTFVKEGHIATAHLRD